MAAFVFYVSSDLEMHASLCLLMRAEFKQRLFLDVSDNGFLVQLI